MSPGKSAVLIFGLEELEGGRCGAGFAAGMPKFERGSPVIIATEGAQPTSCPVLGKLAPLCWQSTRLVGRFGGGFAVCMPELEWESPVLFAIESAHPPIL